MEESRIDFLLLERSSCQNKWLSEQEAEIQPVVTITQDKPALSIKIKGRPGENEDLTNFFCTQLFFQPLQGRRMCFSFQAWSSRVYLSLDKLKSVSLSEETDEVTEEAAFQNKSADSVILVHDENDEFLRGSNQMPSWLLDHKLQHWLKNYTYDFLSHAKNPFPILVLLVVGLFVMCDIIF